MARPSDEPLSREFTLHLDVQVTRRKFWAIVCDPDGNTVWATRWPSEAIAWLDMQGITRYLIAPNPERPLAATTSAILIERQD